MRSVTAAPHGTPRKPGEIREEKAERRGALLDRAEGPRGGRSLLIARPKPPRRFESAGDLGLFLSSCVVPFHRSFPPPCAFPRLPRAFLPVDMDRRAIAAEQQQPPEHI